MGVRSIGLVGCGCLAAALVVDPAAAQAPGAGPARAGMARVAMRGVPVRGPGRDRSRGGFRGAGFGTLASAGPYAWGAGGSGRTVIDASVRTYPSPDELVPPAWSYGTYGIPTVPGIAHPPSGAPVVYVIDGGRRSPGARVLSRGAADGWTTVDPEPTAGGAKVVTVRVPAR